jgi:hypothetical protein
LSGEGENKRHQKQHRLLEREKANCRNTKQGQKKNDAFYCKREVRRKHDNPLEQQARPERAGNKKRKEEHEESEREKPERNQGIKAPQKREQKSKRDEVGSGKSKEARVTSGSLRSM